MYTYITIRCTCTCTCSVVDTWLLQMQIYMYIYVLELHVVILYMYMRVQHVYVLNGVVLCTLLSDRVLLQLFSILNLVLIHRYILINSWMQHYSVYFFIFSLVLEPHPILLKLQHLKDMEIIHQTQLPRILQHLWIPRYKYMYMYIQYFVFCTFLVESFTFGSST